MFLSVFDIFKIGIGPSSSHTMGSMTAAAMLLNDLRGGKMPVPCAGEPAQLNCTLHGSLAFTGKGHATDRAVILGLCGFEPATIDADAAETALARVHETGSVEPEGLGSLRFRPDEDLVFDYGPPLPGHANGLVLRAFDAHGALRQEETYYSIGGGFVVTADELAGLDRSPKGLKAAKKEAGYPYPFGTAKEMLEMGARAGKTIAEMKRANEQVHMEPHELDARVDQVGKAMSDCLDRGLRVDGILPGGLNVRRRAKKIHERLMEQRGSNMAQPHVANDWMSVYAMAVNEENAAGGRVVTAPTNGAAGVIPAVLSYFVNFVPGADEDGVVEFLLTAGAIGILYMLNASISGAEVGCQGEVGVACSMAAGGLTAAMGGSMSQVENAAEIGMEHNLGLTCDPVGGLVQIPCIERNAMAAVKAINAQRMAFRGEGKHRVSLDKVIKTMRDTGADMKSHYKETSRGGLAVNVIEC